MSVKSDLDFPIILVKNLPYGTNSKELYELFGRFGNIQEIRTHPELNQAFVIYKNYSSCLTALEKLKGYNLNGKYLVLVIYRLENDKVKELQDKIKKESEEKKVIV